MECNEGGQKNMLHYDAIKMKDVLVPLTAFFTTLQFGNQYCLLYPTTFILSLVTDY